MRVPNTALILVAWLPSFASAQRVTAYVNGRWFNGAGFVDAVFYSVDGILRTQKPAQVDTTIDLMGGFVVPPFAEAHNHNLEGSPRTDATLARYIAEGIFYVMNPNNLPGSRAGMAGRINEPNRVDVIFANGGLTVSGGHPVELVERNVARGAWPPSYGEGAFYHTIDDRTALGRKWPAILAARPDFVKIYLLYSNEYERRRNDTSVHAIKGLNPALVPEIARRAHEAGLRVGAHIENAADFRAAVSGGVDMIMHMPGYGWGGVGDSAQYALTRADAENAARRSVTVITTLAFGRRADQPARAPGQIRRDALNAANLRLLKEAGVKMAIGSDNYGATALSEALYLSDLGVFSNGELLQLWSGATPALIFPRRKIGVLRDGYEASFLVLEADPLADFENVRRIVLRVKQGLRL